MGAQDSHRCLKGPVPHALLKGRHDLKNVTFCFARDVLTTRTRPSDECADGNLMHVTTVADPQEQVMESFKQ